MGLDLTTYAMIVEELSRGWISISGVVNTHFIGSYLLMKFGTEEQKQRLLPQMATGEIRAAFSLSEPELGSDVAAIKTSAHEDAPTATGRSTARRCGSPTACARASCSCSSGPTRTAEPPHKGMTCFICEKEPGAAGEPRASTSRRKIKKLGYKGVESTELVFDGYRCPADMVLGGEEAGLNKGFPQMMDALEVGRVNVAARGVGIAQRALELALRYSPGAHGVRQADRPAPGDPVQARRHGDQGRGRAAAHAQGRADEGRRRALATSRPAWRSCSPPRPARRSSRTPSASTAATATRKEYEIERLYRDAPLLLIGEGTSEIQRMVIGRTLLRRHKI